MVEPLHTEQPAAERPRVIELNDKGNAVRSSVRSAEIGLSLEHHQLCVYRAETPWLGSVNISPVKKRKSSLTRMTAGSQRQIVTRTSFDEEGAKGEVRLSAKSENVIDRTPAVSGAPQLEAKSGFQVLNKARREY